MCTIPEGQQAVELLLCVKLAPQVGAANRGSFSGADHVRTNQIKTSCPVVGLGLRDHRIFTLAGLTTSRMTSTTTHT